MPFHRVNWARFSIATRLIWAFLALEAVVALFERNFLIAFVASGTLIVSLFPLFFARRFDFELPRSMMTASVLFVFATLFLGEVEEFYDRFWWWDVMLHGGSAIGFGLIGFLVIFMMFQGDRYAAPPWAMGLFAYCFAVAIGTLWEIFEYTMDQSLGTNMQRTGLPDTMKDLIMNTVGGFIGAFSGTLYLKAKRAWPFSGPLHDFIKRNRKYFSKFRDD